MVDFAARQSRNAAYDLVVALLDTDADWNEEGDIQRGALRSTARSVIGLGLIASSIEGYCDLADQFPATPRYHLTHTVDPRLPAGPIADAYARLAHRLVAGGMA